MQSLNIEQNNLYLNNLQNYNQDINASNDLDKTQLVHEVEQKRIDNAVSVSISNENVKSIINSKISDFTQTNTNAQQILGEISQGNNEHSSFFETKRFDSKNSLEQLSYDGKAFSSLNKQEASNLLEKESFFGDEQTANRILNFASNVTGESEDYLKDVKESLKKGYEEAMKLFGDKLPPESLETKNKVLDVIDKKIAEMLKTDLEKQVDAKFLENNNI